MNKEKQVMIANLIVVFLFIGIPLLVMFYDITVGAALFVVGALSLYRAWRWNSNQSDPIDKSHQLRDANAAGKTIYVQVVDDFGRELPASEVERRLADARAIADPRDIVVPVNFPVKTNQDVPKVDS